MHRPLLIAVALAVCATAALANDGVVERTAGGLVFKHNDEIDMLSEDLFVSLDRVRVRYRFRNRTSRDVRVIVGFPLPDRDPRADAEGDTSYPSDFRTLVDGRPVTTQVEHRAFWQGTEHTDLLNRLEIPIRYGEDGDLAPTVRVLNALPAAEQERLLALGLVEPVRGPDDVRSLSPSWTVRETWYWEQVFPVGRDLVIEHRYVPGVGTGMGTQFAFPEYRSDPEMQAEMRRYCIDRDFLAALDRMSARSTPERPVLLGEQRVGYILTTGAGWRSPIADFRLVVDKGSPENIVSFCGEGVRRISPTRFEMRRRNWRPDRDLAVLIITPDREAD